MTSLFCTTSPPYYTSFFNRSFEKVEVIYRKLITSSVFLWLTMRLRRSLNQGLLLSREMSSNNDRPTIVFFSARLASFALREFESQQNDFLRQTHKTKCGHIWGMKVILILSSLRCHWLMADAERVRNRNLTHWYHQTNRHFESEILLVNDRDLTLNYSRKRTRVACRNQTCNFISLSKWRPVWHSCCVSRQTR